MVEKAGPLSRRQVLVSGASAAGIGLLSSGGRGLQAERVVTKGRIKQSVCKWCYKDLSVEELCAAAAGMGLRSVELLTPESYDIVKRYGLVCAVTNTHTIPRGLNNPEHREPCLAAIRESIEAASRAGFPNVITFSGNREGNARRRWPRALRDRSREGRRSGREERRDHRHGASQLQGQSRRLHGRQHVVGCRAGQASRFRAVQAPLRHLPYADHGGRCDPHYPRVSPVYRPLPHRRQPRAT